MTLGPRDEQEELREKGWLNDEPVFKEGPIASGPVVAAAKEFVAWVLSTNRNYLGLEMESGGVLAAVDGTFSARSSPYHRGRRRRRGSRMSRSPSPKRFRPSTARMIAAPGMRLKCGA